MNYHFTYEKINLPDMLDEFNFRPWHVVTIAIVYIDLSPARVYVPIQSNKIIVMFPLLGCSNIPVNKVIMTFSNLH